MGLFGKKKDWNVIAIMFETKNSYRVNGNRGKGNDADAIRDGAKKHDRTLFWAVFDQKGAFLEGGQGPGRECVPRDVMQRLERELPKLKTVRTILSMLEKAEADKVAKVLEWSGYPAAKADE